MEGDNVEGDVEKLRGGSGSDFLVGNLLNSVFTAGAGNDTVNGMLGNDTLDEGSGANRSDTYIHRWRQCRPHRFHLW